MPNDDEESPIEERLREELLKIRKEIDIKTAELDVLRERDRAICAFLKRYTKVQPAEVSREQIIAFLVKESTEDKRFTVTQLADHFGIDGRRISKRVAWLSKHGEISGDSQNGFYIPPRRG